MTTEPRHFTWSPSKLFCWEECPAKAKYKYLDKVPEAVSPALARGTRIHGLCEDWVKSFGVECAPEILASRALLDELHQAHFSKRAFVELEIAFDAQWKLCAWMAPTVVSRFKIDALLLRPPHVIVTDWKTGKLREGSLHTYKDQLSLYCLAVGTALLEKVPWGVDAGPDWEVSSRLWFTDHAKEVWGDNPLRASGVELLREAWLARVSGMLDDRQHKATSGKQCYWCPYRAAKGGPCAR